MKYLPKYAISILLCAFFLTGFGQEKVVDGFDFDYVSALDKESHEIILSVRSHYKLTSGHLEKLREKNGTHYKDSVLLPLVISVSRNTLKGYSVGEIYNYKRHEIEQKLGEQVRIALMSQDIEMADFFISSVKLSDELMRKFEKEHIERVKDNEKEGNKH